MRRYWSRVERKPRVVIIVVSLAAAQYILWTSPFSSTSHRMGVLLNAVSLIGLLLSRPQRRAALRDTDEPTSRN